MRAILFPSSYSPVVGGLQTVVQSLARHLQEGEHDIRVVTNRYPRSLMANEILDGIKVDRFLFIKSQLDQLRRNRADLFAASLYIGPDSARGLKTLFHDFRPDVVNVHFPDGQIPFILKLRKQFTFKLIVSLHGHDVERAFDTSDNGNGAVRLNKSAVPLREILREADAVTAVSQYLLDRACLIEPAIKNKGHVIYNGIDRARFDDVKAHVHRRPYIFALGRLTHTKGFDLLIEAFARTALPKDVDLIIAGDGTERERLARQVNELDLNDKIHFFGQAFDKQVVALMKGSLFVAVPSRNEGFGIVALEALAAGKPLLASKTGGLQEWLTTLRGDDNQTVSDGITLVEPTVEGIASGLSALFDRSDSQTEIRIPDEYMWPRIAERYEQVMLSVDDRARKAFTANG